MWYPSSGAHRDAARSTKTKLYKLLRTDFLAILSRMFHQSRH